MMDNEEGNDVVMEPQSQSIAEMCAEMLRLSMVQNGNVAFRAFLNSVKYANIMIGSLIDIETGEKKYPLDTDGKYIDVILRKAMSDIYNVSIIPITKGDITGHNIVVTVGESFHMRGSVETAQIITTQALDHAWNIALWQAQGCADPIFHLLGAEELLPPNTMLSDIGAMRTLQTVIEADTYLAFEVEERAMELANDIVSARNNVVSGDNRDVIMDDNKLKSKDTTLEDDHSLEDVNEEKHEEVFDE